VTSSPMEEPKLEELCVELYCRAWGCDKARTLEGLVEYLARANNESRYKQIQGLRVLLQGICAAWRSRQPGCPDWLAKITDADGRIREPHYSLYSFDHDGLKDGDRFHAWRRRLIYAHIRAIQGLTEYGQWTSNAPLTTKQLCDLCQDITNEPYVTKAGESTGGGLPALQGKAVPPFAIGFVADLVNYVCRGSARPTQGQAVSVGALLVEESKGKGTLYRLSLEKTSRPTHRNQKDDGCALYPHLDAAFICQTQDFCTGCDDAFQAGLALIGQTREDFKVDLRWNLEPAVAKGRVGQGTDPMPLKGPSVGAAFALGVAKVLTDHLHELQGA